MNLLKDLNEMAAERVATPVDAPKAAMPLFQGIVSQVDRVNEGEGEYLDLHNRIGLATVAQSLREASFGTQTPTDVITKLKNFTTPLAYDRYDVRIFGLEDSDGNIVRVTVKSDQAKDFEQALQAVLGDASSDNNEPEIAEVIFKLKDQFDILKVDWPDIEEDEEVNQQAVPMDGEQEDELPSMDDELPPMEAGGDETEDVRSLLSKFIDMMKADTEARAAEAQARAAEAKSREQELATQQITAKVKQEEQMLDMEADEKARKEQEKETKRLAKLAQWKHNIAKEQGITDEEEWAVPMPQIHPEEKDEPNTGMSSSSMKAGKAGEDEEKAQMPSLPKVKKPKLATPAKIEFPVAQKPTSKPKPKEVKPSKKLIAQQLLRGMK